MLLDCVEDLRRGDLLKLILKWIKDKRRSVKVADGIGFVWVKGIIFV
jgi:hypothetical protein